MTKIDPSIFKAYDVRGTVPDQMNEPTAYAVGRAIAGYLTPRELAIGRDMRISSDAMFGALTDGLRDSGVNVIDLGLVSTDGLYYAVGTYDLEGGVMITASHNPKQYNGFKICRRAAVPLSGNEGLFTMRDAIMNDTLPPKSATRGTLRSLDISQGYAEFCLKFIDISKVRKYKVVIDAGNGMAGATLPPVLKKLPIEVVPLYFELDGNFPNHPASPLEPENLVDIQKKIAEVNADFGVAFDGDADRMFLLDANGKQLGGDMTTALVSKSLLSKSKGETILYNLICSRAVPELVTRLGGKPVRTKVGHALIKPQMKELNAIFGGEHSGHFYFRDFWFADSGMIAFLVCLELISIENRPLHELVHDIDPYVRSGEINSTVNSTSERIAAIKKHFANETQDTLDGLSISFQDYWFNLRGSNTEPLLRLNVEARDERALKTGTEELLKLIRS